MVVMSVSPVDESGKQFRLVAGELGVGEDEALQPDGELDVAGADHVLNLEVFELCLKRGFDRFHKKMRVIAQNLLCPPHLETQLLHDPRVLPRSKPRVFLGLGAGANHLARAEYERLKCSKHIRLTWLLCS